MSWECWEKIRIVTWFILQFSEILLPFNVTVYSSGFGSFTFHLNHHCNGDMWNAFSMSEMGRPMSWKLVTNIFHLDAENISYCLSYIMMFWLAGYWNLISFSHLKLVLSGSIWSTFHFHNQSWILGNKMKGEMTNGIGLLEACKDPIGGMADYAGIRYHN